MAGGNMPMKNSSGTIGNRNRELPAFSEVPQSTAPPRTPGLKNLHTKNMRKALD